MAVSTRRSVLSHPHPSVIEISHGELTAQVTVINIQHNICEASLYLWLPAEGKLGHPSVLMNLNSTMGQGIQAEATPFPWLITTNNLFVQFLLMG